MTTPTQAAAPATPPPQPAPAAPATAPLKRLLPRLMWPAGLAVLGGIAIFLVYTWWSYRQTHSITADAFVEAHIVNVAPQTVTGHIVRFLVEENDRVKEGDLLVQIDQEPYQVQVDIKRAAVLEAEKSLATAVAQARGMAAQTRSSLFNLRHAMEDVRGKVVELRATIAELDTAKAKQARATADYKRALSLQKANAGAISHQDIDQYQEAYRVAAAQINQAIEHVCQLRVSLGLPAMPPSGEDLAEVPADLDQNFSTVRQAMAESLKSATQLGYISSSWDGTPEQAIKEFYRQDKNGNVDAIYAKLIDNSPSVMQARANLQQVKSDLDQALLNLRYTRIRAPFPGVVVKRYCHLGDFASPGVAILSMYNPDMTYVTANLEEDRLPGVAPGNAVELQIDAFAEPFRGRVVWISKSTGAQFALMPRNVVSGEFTKVVQRVPVRIAIDKDERWPLLRAGLSVEVEIGHGKGDPNWAAAAAKEMARLEARYNLAGD